jgi:hypothetical protein
MDRRSEVLKLAQREGLDVLVVARPENVFYLSGVRC